MPRCPYKGQVVRNNHLKTNMHRLATYRDGKDVKGIYHDMTHVLAVRLRKAIREDDQNIIVICGQPGSGKSSLAVALAKEIKPGWTLEDGYIYDRHDFEEKLSEKKTKEVFVFDEATLIVNAKDSLKQDSKDIIGMLDTCRVRHNTSIFVLPGFDSLNKEIRERLCQYRIYCLGREEKLRPDLGGRGFYKVYIPKRGEWGSTYWQKVGVGVFQPMDKETKAEYDRVKNQHLDEYLRRITKADKRKVVDEEDEEE